jgi:alpha-beta hydrolase superfamily lysophospholipase
MKCRMMIRPLAAAALSWLAGAMSANAAPCQREDPAAAITGAGECIALRSYGAPAAGVAPTLVVVIHGDIVGGGPARSHFPVAEELARRSPGAVVVALLRPGYTDGAGRASTGDSLGHVDNYTAPVVDALAAAIARLRAIHGARRVALVGFSGGGAIAAIMLGRHPGIAEAGLIVACPCDIQGWRAERRGRKWTRSESPADYVARVPTTTRVIALVGEIDGTTPAWLTRDYAARLADAGVTARAELRPGLGHLGIFKPDIVAPLLAELLATPR